MWWIFGLAVFYGALLAVSDMKKSNKGNTDG